MKGDPFKTQKMQQWVPHQCQHANPQGHHASSRGQGWGYAACHPYEHRKLMRKMWREFRKRNRNAQCPGAVNERTEAKSQMQQGKRGVPHVTSQGSKVKSEFSGVMSHIPEVKREVPEVMSKVPEVLSQAPGVKSEVTEEETVQKVQDKSEAQQGECNTRQTKAMDEGQVKQKRCWGERRKLWREFLRQQGITSERNVAGTAYKREKIDRRQMGHVDHITYGNWMEMPHTHSQVMWHFQMMCYHHRALNFSLQYHGHGQC